MEWSAKSTVKSPGLISRVKTDGCRFYFQQPISCADLHPERNIIVLGSETSKLLIYDTLSSYYIATITLKMNTSVKCVRFSPGLLLKGKMIEEKFRWNISRWISSSSGIAEWKCLYV